MTVKKRMKTGNVVTLQFPELRRLILQFGRQRLLHVLPQLGFSIGGIIVDRNPFDAILTRVKGLRHTALAF